MEFHFVLLLQLVAFLALVAAAQAGLISHGHAIAPAHYAAAPVAYAPGSSALLFHTYQIFSFGATN